MGCAAWQGVAPPAGLYSGRRALNGAFRPALAYLPGMMETPITTIALVRDLLFSSKLTAAAKATGKPLKVVRDAAKLAEIDGARLIVDLNADTHLSAAVAWKQRTGGEVIGFISHLAGDAIAEARRLGVDRVMSNGSLAAHVDSLLI